MANALQVDMLAAGIVGNPSSPNFNGIPLAGGKVTFYVAGTTTLKTIYVDAVKITASVNPVILDSVGVANIYADGNYDIKIDDANDVTIATYLSFTYSNSGGGSGLFLVETVTASKTLTFLDRIYLVDTSSGAINITLAKIDANVAGGVVIIINTSTGALTITASSGDTVSQVASVITSKANEIFELRAAGTNWYDIGHQAPLGTSAQDSKIDTNTSNIFRAFEEIQNNHGGALLMEKGWSDTFGIQGQQGADETPSLSEQYDGILELYKGLDGGSLIADFPFTAEANYLQKEFTNANQTTSQATFTNASAIVTISTGSWPTNALNMRISPDAGVTWFDILSRDTNLQITLATNFTGTTGANDYIIRPTEFAGGFAKLNSGGFGADLTGGKVYAASTQGNGSPANAFNDIETDVWGTDLNTVIGWISVDFGAGSLVKIIRYTLHMRSTGVGQEDAMPKNWTFEWSDDNATWNVIDTRTNETAWTLGETRIYTGFTNTSDHRYYRLNVSANDGNALFLLVGEIEMMEAFAVINEPAAIIPTFAQLKDFSGATQVGPITATETKPGTTTIFYAIITGPVGLTSYSDIDLKVIVFNQTSGAWKNLVRFDGSNFQINTNTANDNSVVTWANSTINDFNFAVSEAIQQNAVFQMDKVNIDSITSAELAQAVSGVSAGGFIIGSDTRYGVITSIKSLVNTEAPSVDLIRTPFIAQRAGMDFRAKTFNPNFVPAEAYLWAIAEHSDVDGPGIFYVSRDGGTTWVIITMPQQGLPVSGNIRIFRGTLVFTTEPSGQDFRCRYVTAQNKDQFLHAWGLQART